MTVSKVQQTSKSSKVDDGGTVAAPPPIGLVDASPEVVPVEEGGVRY